jgi:hypothetical protein
MKDADMSWTCNMHARNDQKGREKHNFKYKDNIKNENAKTLDMGGQVLIAMVKESSIFWCISSKIR